MSFALDECISPCHARRAVLMQGSYVCLPCALEDAKAAKACAAVIAYLQALVDEPLWRLQGDARGNAEGTLRDGVFEELKKECGEEAAREMANLACAAFLGCASKKMLSGAICVGPPSCGKSATFDHLCKLFGASGAGRFEIQSMNLSGECVRVR